ncbi:MAG: NAD(P)H-quinone oxidoreductase [Clostridia bacterium]|nr:NAD(P)H-quinone oxidoreductase [Clostridia bacterium]
MKAIVINKKDHTLSYTDVENPVIKPGEVIIEVYAAAINRADLLQREGNYPPPPGCPEWPGLEVAGIIKEVAPDVTRWKVGDKVCALLGGGGYAEYVSVPAEMVMPIPKGLSFVEAAAIPEVYMTAYLNLFYVGDAKPGETLLMNAGASGLASAVIPMAKAFGLRVITTVLGEEKVKEVAYLKADRVVDTTKEDIAEVLREEEQNGAPVNIAIDCLGGEALGRCLKYVARGNRWIQIATLAGDISAVDFRNIFVKNIRIIGSTLRSKTPEEKGLLLSELVDKTWCKFENGEMKLKIYKTFPIQDADAAQAVLYRGENVGKVVLTVKNKAFDLC